jgi:uncharacterized protein DUF268
VPDPIRARLSQAARERGPLTVAGSCLSWGARYALGRVRPGGSFEWDGQSVPLFHHRYHYTWMNERCVELALARRVLDEHPGASILEVGNVLGHYMDTGHTVVDLYERAPGVVNEDVADFDPGRRYDLILSLSTIEHVGFDEDVIDPDKPLRAVERLRGLLEPGGLLWLTVPVGYNPSLDERVRDGRLPADRVRALRRERGRWGEVEPARVWDAQYDRLLFTASGVVVCELRG